MTHLCFVAPNLYPVLANRADIPVVGGAEVQQNFIARALQRQGVRVSVVSQDFGQPEALDVDGITVHKTFRADEGLPGLRALHPRMTRLWQALAAADADVYYVRCAAMTMALVAAFCRHYGRQCVFAGASDLDFQPGRELIEAPWYRLMYRWGLRQADAIVAQNPHQVQAVRRHYQRDAQLIRSMFIPEAQPAPPPRARPQVLWCGVLREAKRVEVLVELARKLPQLDFRVIGGADGSAYSQGMAATLRQLATELPNLFYEGFLPYGQADVHFTQSWVFINTSLSEGFPNTFLQAWSRGVPTLSFVDVGARQAGQTVGRVCADDADMAKVLGEWQTHPAQWQADSRRCADYFEAVHSEQAVTQAYLQLLNLVGQPALVPPREVSHALPRR